MSKHKRYSDKPKSDSIQPDETSRHDKEISSPVISDSPKSLLSITKYAYLIAVAALLSGIFTPITLGLESEMVVFGMLTIFLGLAGALFIFRGIKTQKSTTLFICGGLTMIVVSVIVMHELADHSLFYVWDR